jgi:hypothetical protein
MKQKARKYYYFKREEHGRELTRGQLVYGPRFEYVTSGTHIRRITA